MLIEDFLPALSKAAVPAFFSTAVLVYVFVRSHRITGFVSIPNPVVDPRGRPVALGGGPALALGLAAGLLASGSATGVPPRAWAAWAGVLSVGLADDLRGLPPVPKFVLECLSVGLYLAFAPLAWWQAALAAVLLLFTVNAWNYLDVADGLLGWSAVFGFGGLTAVFVAALPGGGGWPATAALCSAAGAGAVLIWNRPPARIYFGDSGSLLTGLLFGVLVVEGAMAEGRLLVPLLICGTIPFAETCFIFHERMRRGIAFYSGTPDHFALRWREAGLRDREVLRRVRRAAALPVALAVPGALLRESNLALALVAAADIALVLLAWRYFRKLPVPRRDRS